MTIDGEDYTPAQVSYYYTASYQNLMRTYGDYASLIGLDTSKSLDSQPAWGTEEYTWDEYFKEQAVDSMRFVQGIMAKVEAEGLELDEADLAEFDANIASMKATAASNGYSYKAYLTATYGSTMTPEAFEASLKEDMLASKYVNNYYSNISVTDEEIEAYYEENKNSYDIVDGAYVYLSGAAASTTDADGKTVAATDEEHAAAMAAAKETMEKILDAYKKGGDLEALAAENGATYIGNTEMTYSSDTTYGEWLFDEARTEGDLELVEDENSKRYYILQFNSRQRRDEASTYDVRSILINEESEGIDASAADVDAQILAKAEEVMAEWKATSRTEVDFALLAAQYDYDGAYLRDWSVGGDYTVLRLNRYYAGSIGRIVTVDLDGVERASLDVNAEVISVSAAGRYIAVLYAGRVVVYTSDLTEYARMEGTERAKSVLMCEDGSVLVLESERGTRFLP